MKERILRDIARELELRQKKKIQQQKLNAQADRLKFLLQQRRNKMAVPKAKKPKKKQHTKPELLEVIQMTQYLDLAVMARTLHAKGWKKSSIESFIKSYGILFQELSDRRQSPWGMINDCNDMVGINIPDLFDTILQN